MIAAALILAAAGLFPAFQPTPTLGPEPLLWETPVSWQRPLRPQGGPVFSPAGAKKVAEAREIKREKGPAPAAEYLKGSSEPEVRLIRAGFLAEAGHLAAAQAEYEKILNSKNTTAPRALALDGYKAVLRRRIAAGEKALYRPLVECLKDEWLNEEALNLMPAILADPQAPAEVKAFVRRQEPVMALRLGRYEQAAALWAKPADKSETQWLAQTEGRRGNFLRAAELRLSLAAKGRNAEAWTAFEILAKGGLFTAARDLAEKQPDLKKHPDFEWRLGLAALAARDASARAHFQAILDNPKAKSRHSGARYFLARSLEAAGLAKEARAAYAESARGGFDYYRLLAQGRLETAGRPLLAESLSRLLTPGPSGRDQDSLGYYLWITEKGLTREGMDQAARRLAESGAGLPGGAAGGELKRLLASLDWGGLFDLLRKDEAVRETAGPAGPLWGALAATVAAWGENYRLAVSLFARLPSAAPGLRGWSHPLIYAREAQAAHREHGLSPSLLLALIRTESAFQADIMSPSNARGLMQLLPATAAKVAAALGEPAPGPVDLFDPELNIRYGSWYLQALIDGFGDESLALAGYNGGPYNIKSLILAQPGRPLDIFIECLLFEETARYVKRITESRFIYESVYLGRAVYPDLTRPVLPPNSSLPDF